MSKPNKRHGEKCKQYKTEGRREINKKIKQERHQKRMEKIKKRREEGKTYKYTAPASPLDKLYREINSHNNRKDSMPEFQRLARVFGRLDSFVRKIKEEERAEEIKKRKTKAKGKLKENRGDYEV